MKYGDTNSFPTKNCIKICGGTVYTNCILKGFDELLAKDNLLKGKCALQPLAGLPMALPPYCSPSTCSLIAIKFQNMWDQLLRILATTLKQNGAHSLAPFEFAW